MVIAKGKQAVAPRRPCGFASRDVPRPQSGRPWCAGPKDKAAGGVNRRAPHYVVTKAEVLRREWRARESRHALRLPRSGCGSRLPLAGSSPSVSGFGLGHWVFAYLLGEEMDFVKNLL